jgi:hypothetical protein
MKERRFLEAKKVELFLQAIDDTLQDMLFMILRNKVAEGGFASV